MSTANILKNALGEEVAKQIAAKTQPIGYFDLLVNNKRREGINPRTNKPFNDSHVWGRFTGNIQKLKEAIAEAEANGWDNVQIYVNLWFQHDGTGTGQFQTGRADRTVPAEHRFKPQPQTKAENEHPAVDGDPTAGAAPADAAEELVTP